MPNHADSVWYTVGLHTGYTWHSALDTSFKVVLQRLERHMLVKSVQSL